MDPEVTAAKAPITLAVYQDKALLGKVDENLAVVDAVFREAAKKRVDLLLFPELFVCGYGFTTEAEYRKFAYSPTDAESPLGRVAKLARELSIAVCIGYAEAGEDGRLYNSAAVYGRDGVLAANYRKVHTYCPPEHMFAVGGPEQFKCFRLPGLDFNFGTLICYDIEFPEPARVLMLAGCEILLVPTALCTCPVPVQVTPICTVPSRAVENLVAILYCNLIPISDTDLPFTGLSGIIGPDGVDIARADTHSSTLLVASYNPAAHVDHARRNPYRKDRRPECYAPIAAQHAHK